ncbi:MAG TPA: dethiobiotin synthase [Chthoniobacterales bacterium]
MFFITGTNTGAGKTFFTSLLVRALRAEGINAVGFKPICSGDRSDPEILVAASDNALTLNECNPVWLRPPVSPYAASLMENRQVDLDLIFDQFSTLKTRFAAVIVEGVGGWRVPIRRDYFVSDLAREIGQPIIVVAANQLGALNHTLLTLDGIQSAGLPVAGIVLNTLAESPDDPAILTNRSILEDLTRIPVLTELMLGQSVIAPHIAKKIAAGAG